MSTVSYANGYNREVYALLENFWTNTAKDAILLFLEQGKNHQQVSGYIDDLGIDKESLEYLAF